MTDQPHQYQQQQARKCDGMYKTAAGSIYLKQKTNGLKYNSPTRQKKSLNLTDRSMNHCQNQSLQTLDQQTIPPHNLKRNSSKQHATQQTKQYPKQSKQIIKSYPSKAVKKPINNLTKSGGAGGGDDYVKLNAQAFKRDQSQRSQAHQSKEYFPDEVGNDEVNVQSTSPMRDNEEEVYDRVNVSCRRNANTKYFSFSDSGNVDDSPVLDQAKKKISGQPHHRKYRKI